MSQQQVLSNSPMVKRKTNAFAIIFFLMGALPIYQKLQSSTARLRLFRNIALNLFMPASFWCVGLVGIMRVWSRAGN